MKSYALRLKVYESLKTELLLCLQIQMHTYSLYRSRLKMFDVRFFHWDLPVENITVWYETIKIFVDLNHLNSRLRKLNFKRDIFSHKYIGISCLRKITLQNLQLTTSECRSFTALLSANAAVEVSISAKVKSHHKILTLVAAVQRTKKLRRKSLCCSM